MPTQANHYGGMTDTEIEALKNMWARLCPLEKNSYFAKCDEAKWEMEHVCGIKNFWAPEPEEAVSFEDSYQAHCESYIIWK